MKIESNRVFRKSRDILAAPLDGELVLLSIPDSKFYGSGEVGKAIWDLIDDSRDLQGIVDELIAIYDVSESDCMGGVCDFLSTLLEKGLIE